MKKTLLIMTAALFVVALMNDSAPIDLSKVFFGRTTWQLEDMAGGPNQAYIKCYCVSTADASNEFCICRNVSDKTRPYPEAR